ncbi:MAG: carbohydrate binding domain-containing protein [Chloroflexota bacterium]|nr:carbohydrate binding domain-containing protein [Chloroflexota bacterium]
MKDKRISLGLFVLTAIMSSFLLAFLPLVSDTGPVTLAEYLPTPRPSEPCDVCEPNNSLSQACGPLAPGQSYEFFVRCTANLDEDYYYIDLETTGTVALDLTSIPPGTDYDIYLYDKNKTIQCYSNQPGNHDEHATCHLTRLGRYYVRIYPFTECNDNDSYTLAVTYPTPAPSPTPPIPTATPTPPCNVHIDDFGDTNPDNDLHKPSSLELHPPECGTITLTGSELQLSYDLTPQECTTARYTTALSLNASPYEMLALEIKSSDREELVSTAIGLSDEAGHEMSIKAGDFLNYVLTGTYQGVDLPLAAFSTVIDTTHLEALFIEFADTRGASQGTIYLDSLRLEKSHVPLTVDNFDDLADPNALGGGLGTYQDQDPGTIIETAYIAEDTYDASPGSYAISYTLPSGGWALWETYLPGLDVSDYAFLSFYIKGTNGGEKVNLYLADGDDQGAYVDVETYVSITTDWTPVRVPLQAFEGVALTDMDRIKFAFEWEPMTSTIFLDDLRFVADTLLVDDFCDHDENNSLDGEVGTFTSSPYCAAAVTPTLSGGTLRLDYDVTAGPGCYSGYWSKTLTDLNPYRTLTLKVRGERCGEVAAISARTISVTTDKIKLGDYLLDGITDQWQKVRIPLAASPVVADWAQGDSYAIAFEAHQAASEGTTWWDDVTFDTACAPLWVDNFNDEDDTNALGGTWYVFTGAESEITASIFITQAYGDGGAGLVLSYTVPAGDYAGWKTDLSNVDLSDYDRLVFNVKGGTGGETPNVYLVDDGGARQFVNIEDYIPPFTEWQTIVIPLQHFNLDLTQVQALEIITEWEYNDVEGTLFLDNIHFLPSAGCSQITQNLVFLPMAARDYAPLTFDPVWDFESGTEGWTTYKTYTPSLAMIAAETSPLRSLWGHASLAVTTDLVGGDESLGEGVAYVDLKKNPPPGITAPLDLACKPTSCWLYVPTCGLGDPAEPNFVQLFVKDENGKFEYGASTPVMRNQWFEVKLRPSTLTPYGGSMQEGFAPHAIIRLGVRFSAGSDEAAYQGKVYIDACGWQEIDPDSTAAVGACRADEGILNSSNDKGANK